jgi:hypothetical protein
MEYRLFTIVRYNYGYYNTHKDNVGSKVQRNVRVRSKKQVFTLSLVWLLLLTFEAKTTGLRTPLMLDAEKDPTDFNADAIFARFFP